MNKIKKFGEDVQGFNIPVLNEREIRAAAGILFLIMFISFFSAFYYRDFLITKYAVTIFLTDMVIRVFVNPKYSPSLIIGRLIVGNQSPEYVGAQQKKFAWMIGAAMASVIFTLLVVINSFSPAAGIICITCLLFLFFETAFGICIGCKFYSMFYKEKAQYCPGEVCDVKSKENIQKTSVAQLLIVLGFIAYIFVIAYLFNDKFREKPDNLFGSEISLKSEVHK